MGSQFVEINTSPPDIISMANNLESESESYLSRQGARFHAITNLETPHTMGNGDKFNQQFDKAAYKVPTPVEGKGTLPRNEALKAVALDAGDTVRRLGGNVALAMVAYYTTDLTGGSNLTLDG